MNALSFQLDDSIGILTVDQPESKVNVLNRSLWSELAAALAEYKNRPEWRGLILQSAKPGIFVAGADLKELAGVPSADHPAAREFIELGLRVLEALESLPFPTVACIDGAALGGGLEVALACDHRIAGSNPKTRLGLPEVTLGLIPGWGGTQRLPRIIGVTSAIEVIVGNVQFDADTALDRGLIERVVPSETLFAEARQLLMGSHAHGAWRRQRERKLRPVAVDRAGFTMDDLAQGKVSEEKFNAQSLSAETFAAFRQDVNERMSANLSRPAALAALEVIERGCLLPLSEAIHLETREFLRLAAGPEAKQLIASFFASRKK